VRARLRASPKDFSGEGKFGVDDLMGVEYFNGCTVTAVVKGEGVEAPRAKVNWETGCLFWSGGGPFFVGSQGDGGLVLGAARRNLGSRAFL
jgi:hypothetical protein